jgi:hypothetical protein
MTEIFAAVTNRRLTFWEAPGNTSVRSFAPRTRITVRVNESGQHVLTARADGASFTRVGHDYTATPDTYGPGLTASEVGGIELGTEYGDKVADLAFTLAQLPYPWMDSWADVEPHLVDLYTQDAVEIIHSYPHVLSGGERERLTPAFPELAI